MKEILEDKELSPVEREDIILRNGWTKRDAMGGNYWHPDHGYKTMTQALEQIIEQVE